MLIIRFDGSYIIELTTCTIESEPGRLVEALRAINNPDQLLRWLHTSIEVAEWNV